MPRSFRLFLLTQIMFLTLSGAAYANQGIDSTSGVDLTLSAGGIHVLTLGGGETGSFPAGNAKFFGGVAGAQWFGTGDNVYSPSNSIAADIVLGSDALYGGTRHAPRFEHHVLVESQRGENSRTLRSRG